MAEVMQEWMTTNNAAEYTGLCVRTLKNYALMGRFETRKIGAKKSGKILINKKSLDRWLNGLPSVVEANAK